MTEDNPSLTPGLEALRRRFQDHSRKAQTYYTVMNEIRAVLGSDDAASAWMENSLPAFDGKSPAMLVNEGREEDVLAYIGSLRP